MPVRLIVLLLVFYLLPFFSLSLSSSFLPPSHQRDYLASFPTRRSLHRIPPPIHSLQARHVPHDIQMGRAQDPTHVQRQRVDAYLRGLGRAPGLHGRAADLRGRDLELEEPVDVNQKWE